MNYSNLQTKLAFFGGGSFWQTEAIFQEVAGVVAVTAGYSGGTISEQISTKIRNSIIVEHAEVVQVEYNPKVIAFDELLVIFMTTHNPTLLNQQGTDMGAQYRSIVFFETMKEKAIIDIVIKELKPYFEKPIVTEVKEFEEFFEADAKDQHYYQLNRQFGYCTVMIEQKLEILRKLFANKLRVAI